MSIYKPPSPNLTGWNRVARPNRANCAVQLYDAMLRSSIGITMKQILDIAEFRDARSGRRILEQLEYRGIPITRRRRRDVIDIYVDNDDHKIVLYGIDDRYKLALKRSIRIAS